MAKIIPVRQAPCVHRHLPFLCGKAWLDSDSAQVHFISHLTLTKYIRYAFPLGKPENSKYQNSKVSENQPDTTSGESHNQAHAT